jgi:hypothetical protein
MGMFFPMSKPANYHFGVWLNLLGGSIEVIELVAREWDIQMQLHFDKKCSPFFVYSDC